jgi:predicted sulfurtransferase
MIEIGGHVVKLSHGWMSVFVLVALTDLARAQAPPEQAAPTISQADFKALRAGGNVLTVDVRDAGSYRTGHIPGAASIPLDQMPAHLQELKASKKPIVTYCG